MTHEFLLLSLLFLLPGGVIWLARPDLRSLMKRVALASLPFAATERLFYPRYWTPRFLFDLADRIGFGIEDVLFLVGLSAFSSTAYAVVFRRAPVPWAAPVAPRARPWLGAARPWLGAAARPWLRAAAGIALVLAAAGALLVAGVPVLYASVAAMIAVTAALVGARRDLLVPGLLGALLSATVYLCLCLVFAALVPGVFERTWRPSVLLPGKALLGVPLDEVLYGLGAGLAATVFPAWAFGFRYGHAGSAGD
ncbi:lycopene cyclase domain-containing protein [Sorangium sp. So ce1078]|uniref:lycopene cyclase domain-containing protein n=1 Tax=Sorangium sp. So ce1078 TaxID=3133329 RepID=UPI003F60294D